MHYFSRMVIASVVGYMVAAQFVTIDGVELPYYITILGAGTLKLIGTPADVLAVDASLVPQNDIQVAHKLTPCQS
jgi:hypothetical protein